MIVVGISGASGPILGVRLIEELLNTGEKVAAIVSQPACEIIECEMFRGEPPFSPLKELLVKRGFSGNHDLLSEFKKQ